MADAVLVVNPKAGRGRTLSALPRIRAWAAEEGISLEEIHTQRPGDATHIARRAAEAGARVVAAMGGDGTVSETAAGLVKSDASLAIIPTGTGNDFARALGLRGKLKIAVHTLAHGRPVTIDVGRAGHLVFINTLGVGFAGEVTHGNQQVKRLSGMFSYLAAVLKLLPTYKNPTFHLQGRDWEFQGKGVMVEVGNGRFAGGGFKLCPGADLRDGQLDITFLGDYGPARRFVALPMVVLRQTKRLEGCHFFRSDLVRVGVSRPTYIHTDGNLHHVREPFTIEVLPRALSVLFPERTTGWQKID